MPDPIEPEPTTEPVTPEPAPPVKDETDWKSEARKWESRAKENLKAAEQLALIEEANKTEAQRLEERAAKAEKDLADERLDSARKSIALDKGLTASQAKRLVGSTPEELAADADELLADLGKPSASPRPDPSQGPKPTGGAQDPAQALAEILRA